MGDDIRKYDQTPPPLAEIALETVTLKLAEVTKDDSRKGRFKVTLTNEVRSRHLSDVVHAADWKRLITDFDTKFLETTIASYFFVSSEWCWGCFK